MNETPQRRRVDRWTPLIIPLAGALLLGSYAYTYRETVGLADRLRRIENLTSRVLCRVAPDECFRGDGGNK